MEKNILKVGYINKDGTVNKVYARKLWNHVTTASIDSFNGDANDEEIERRVKLFIAMINKLIVT